MRSKLWIFAVILLFLSMFGVGYFLLSGIPAPVPETAPVSVAPVSAPEPVPAHEVIGVSVQGRSIDAYRYGDGATHLLFVGGVHGGYEWNSVALAYAFMDYLDANPSAIPTSVTVSVIPSLNPDGVYKVIGKDGRFAIEDVPTGTDHSPGRFNAHDVDLNRNFDCKWKPESTWRSKVVSAGTGPFSEPETAALRDFVAKEKPDAVVFWHSKANSVYASECEGGILPATLEMMNAYAKASGYTPVRAFDSYAISGDAEGWLASIGIPAITVELKTHEAIEWDKNLAGVKALLELYTKEEVPL